MVVCDKIHVLAVVEKSAVLSLLPNAEVIVVAKLGSLFNAVANSLSVSNVLGAESTIELTAAVAAATAASIAV